MKIIKGKEKEYKDWCSKNNDPYDRACLTFAERWAELLEEQITKSDNVMQCINDNTDKCSHEADTDGITRFIYGCSIIVLSQYWKYGEYLRKWLNKKYGYNGDVVVNPAIIGVNTKL